MKTIKITKTIEKPKLEIEYDQDPESPREWSNLGYFITVDRKYNSPDNHPDFMEVIKETGDEADSQDEHIELIKEKIKRELGEKVIAIYPVVKYEHSGISYSLGTAHGFDYSNNGFYIITDKTQKEIGADRKDFKKIIESELEVYNKYINGEVYRFTLYDDNGEIEDSCCGFYDVEDILDHLPEEWKDEDLTEYFVN